MARRHPARNNNRQQPNKALLDLFRQYGKELDDKHDRYERIVKISRDITIESKRIIFLLHNVDKRLKLIYAFRSIIFIIFNYLVNQNVRLFSPRPTLGCRT